MTDRTAPAPRICPNCDGHASAAISTGGRDRLGHLLTVTVDCRACYGLGTVQPRPVREGARA
ncbi:hypothetical protein ACIGPN_19950 [Streptomyces afghaniensis]|uniref:hypothetical protein n=1 Tax=Streptomyces afghaniensis TaxID=66865 RepID=UPI0037CF4C46